MTEHTKIPEVMAETTVVDADVHVTLSTEQMAKFADKPYKDRLLNSSAFPASTGSDWDPYMSGRIEQKRSISSPDRIEETIRNKLHIDFPVLNPSINLDKLPNSVAVELMRARNKAFIEIFLDDTSFQGFGVVATQKPDRAAEEIDRLGNEDQIVGIVIECIGSNTPFGDPMYDMIYQSAEDNDLQIAYHASPANDFMYGFPRHNKQMNDFFEVDANANLWGESLTLTSLIVNGVPEKFPDLNFSFLESGLSWVPYLMWRLNKEYAIRRSEAPLLSKSPEEYIRDQFYFASQPLGEPSSPQHLRQMIHTIGADSIMFSSNYPCWDFDHPSELGRHLQTGFTSEEQEKILTATPAKAFSLNV